MRVCERVSVRVITIEFVCLYVCETVSECVCEKVSVFACV